MLRYLYERMLERRISRGAVPECIAVVLSAGDLEEDGLDVLKAFIGWLESLDIRCLLLYVADEGPEMEGRIAKELAGVRARVSLHTGKGVSRLGLGGYLKVVISLGYGGKREVTEAIVHLIKDVELGLIQPEEIDEGLIEANLRFDQKPDIVIRAGGKQLSDFMIWQAAYSELYFTEVNWRSTRKIDLLRAVRDYQARERRFGR